MLLLRAGVIAASVSLAAAASSNPPHPIAQVLSPFPNATFALASQSPGQSRNSPSPHLGRLLPAPKPECPPCDPPFNCVLPAYTCLNNGQLWCSSLSWRDRLQKPAIFRRVQRLQRAVHLPNRLWRRRLLQASCVYFCSAQIVR